ncbi:MAG: PAS domain S-box protein [Gemmatimonadetes bacterium]|nr:PAS domain S-box protein [Gemmatimonadota bacterium]
MQAATLRIAQTAATAATVSSLLRDVHAVVRDLIPAERFYVALYHGQTDTLTFPYVAGAPAEGLAPRRPGKGLTEYVLRTGEPLLATPQVTGELKRRGEVEPELGPNGDWLGVPLRTADRTFGVVAAQGLDAVRFTERDRMLLEFVATQIACALERRHAEQALRESEERYRTLYDDTPSMYFTVDPDGMVLSVNRFGAAQLGYTVEELVGQSVLRVFHDADKAAARERVAECLAHPGRVFHCELRKVRRDGSMLWVKETARATRGRSVEPVVLIVCEDITERKRAEEDLQRERRLFMGGPAVVFRWIADTAGRVEYVSPNVHVVFGYTADDFVSGRVLYEQVIHPEDLSRVVAELDAYGERGAARLQQFYRIVRKDGGVRWLDDFTVFARDEHGRVTHYEGYVLDVTHRRHAEEALRAAEEKYRSMFENAMEGIFQTTPDGRILTANPAVARMLGYESPATLIAQTSDLARQLYADPSRRAEFRRALEERGSVTGFTTQVYRRDGSLIWVSITARAVVDEAHQPLYYEGTIEDITERQRAEEAAAAQQRFLRQVIDLNPNLIFVKDRQGQFTLVNQGLADLYGAAVERLLGRTDADFNPNPAEVERYLRDDRDVMDTGRPKFIAEEPNTDVRTGITRWFQVIKVPLVSPDGVARHVLGVATEITQRKELESQLRQAQKMEAVGQLAGGVAHDFNNMLTAIIGLSALLLRDRTLAGPHRREVEEIQDAARRAATLTQQLLAFSRRQVLQPTVLDLNVVVAEMEELLRRLVGEHIELATSLATDLGLVRVDRNQLEQAIVNLVVNARDAMSGGGWLTIETANAELDAAYAESHPGAQPGRHVLLAVTDTGVGMDRETQTRIFEPFFTTKERGKGTGLGLASVYGIVKQSGGWIWVYSEPGRGSTFKIYLPRVEEPPERAVSRIAVEEPAGGTETVLLVEDESAVRGLAREALEQFGYQVLEAADGAQAVLLARDYPDRIHLLLTDVVMPGMPGSELAERLARARPDIRILFTSGYADTAVSRRGVLALDVAFLQKPYTPEVLARKVREVLDAPPR